MSEDSEEEDYSDRSISDDDDLDEDSFMKFVSDDIHPCTLLAADSIGDPFFPRTTQILLEYQLGRWVPRLRGPRDLYGVSSSGPLSPTRWPYHCEVIDEKVQHIEWTPFVPEPVYVPTGLEIEPVYPNSKEDTVVYLAEDAYKEPCFVYSRVGGNRTSLKQPVDNCDNTLVFEARFESGNLQKVVKVADHEYELTVRPDLFTNKHTQWYYFQVTNTQAEIVYRFTIVNFTKPASLYNRGMKPLFYSEKEAKTHNIGWQRIGDQIKYYKNNLGQDGRHFFSLTWTFQFPHSQDTCYFAHCYPYTYSNLQEYLSGINSDPVRSKFCKIRVLCHTLARNMVYVLTITTPLKTSDSKRKAVILTARVHPGETNSSWIMKGFLDYILGDSSDARLLRDTFIFKVVPMLNPDGVIVGNYRCSLAGRDLNRNYTSLLKESFPSVWYTRNMINRLMEKREVILYCDLHGHSRKQNIFMYGCDGSSRSKTKGLYLQQRIFPLMLSKNCPNIFSFSACKFNVQKSKEGTGRVVMWKMGIRNSFTLEATFCGSTLGNKRGTHFGTKDLESMGYHFCDSLLDYCDPDRSKYYQCLKELEEMEKHLSSERVSDNTDTSLVEISLDVESSSRGSDSSESNDTQTYLLKVTSQARNKKKYLKTKRERNAILANCQNNMQEVYGKEHLLQRHDESNSDGNDPRIDAPDVYVAHCFRRPLPNQGVVKIPGQRFYPGKTWSSSQRMIKSLNKDHRTCILETCKNPIQEVQSRGINIHESCFKMAKCPMNKRPSHWIEKTRIPTESHHQLKSKAKRCSSFQSKRTGTNWTDDEKRIYRDKRIAQTQEILKYLLPIVESSQNRKSTQMNNLINPIANLQQHQLIPTACINRRRYSIPWTPTRNLPFKAQRNLMTDTSEWLQSVPLGSFESLLPLCNLQKKTKHFELWGKKAKDVQLATSQWEAVPLSSNMDASIIRGNSVLQPKEFTMRSSKQRIPYLTKTSKKPSESDGLLTFQLKIHRNS
ncbi:cytosolic carboxypeptidase 3 isoform X1 [Mus musculus]|uniref:Isoform 3 of Cytosolic carboxypeptidase 3 n=2 Tax=Mus musculus TaxID=10090 RepID=Q8CDP0-3|nr:cytosolic carboxypeptidase 3 isoform 2 [Mus musculus]XP_030111518.1 cytosolic carboxypeptidase 3 isoform X1 [Mus musculus]ABI51950.1 cytosolic carboxypeptidase 3 isoform 1 [Mus musculus]|eukprot:NP_848745.2 cytosolic carboxypeptidase 3 isoform 2 [Mus musculus]